MNYSVPTLSIVCMAIATLAGIVIPVALFLVLRKKYHGDILPFFTGCAVFLVFALLIEGTINRFILTSSTGMAIQSNIWLYGIFGGLMAGIFEETGRFTAFKVILKKRRGNNRNALMYGAGHGGFEAIYLLVAGIVPYIVMSVKLNAGMYGTLTAGITDPAILQSLNATFAALATTPSVVFLIGIIERIGAVALQISLSVLVWFAVKAGGRFWFFPLAILLHAVVDIAAVIMASYITNLWIVEAALYVLSGCCVVIAIAVWKKYASDKGMTAEIETNG